MTTDVIQTLVDYLPFLVPLIILQLGLMIFALVDLIHRETTRGPKWVWVLIIVLVNLIGPILYLMIGRQE